MPNNAAVQAIPHRLPEACRPWVILLHQRRDALGPLLRQPLLDLGHQRTGNSTPPVFGMDGQPVDVPSPAVERPDDRTNDSPFGLGYQDVGLVFDNGWPEVVGGVGHARRGVGLPPEFEDCIYIFQPTRSDGQATRSLLGHLRPRQEKKPAAGATCHGPLLVPIN